MEFEEIENGFKATVPLITEEDIRVINSDFDGIVNRFTKMIIKEKDLAMAQYIIKKQQEQIEELKEECRQYREFICVTGGKDIDDITATKYVQIQQEGYLRGRKEEQEKAKQFIEENSIPKRKIKDKLKQLNSEMQYCARQNGKTIKLGKIMALQELLEEDK